MFQEIGSYETFNVIDSILIEEAVRDAEVNGAITEIRSKIDKIYIMGLVDADDEEYGYIPGDYAEQTEDGYVGFLPPMQ